MNYRAFVGGREIADVIIGGKETKEIWAGNTLLWEREKLQYAIGLMLKEIINPRWNGVEAIDEVGFCLEPGLLRATIEKFAYCIMEKENRTYIICAGCKAKEQSEMTMIAVRPYWRLNKKDAPITWGQDSFLKKGIDGIYSWAGDYGFFSTHQWGSAYVTIDNVKKITSTKNAPIFYNLEDMKAWLLN